MMKTKDAEKNKLNVGLYGFTGCNGDQLVIIHSEDRLLDFFASANIKTFSLAKSDNDDSELDLVFIEGSVSSQEQVEHVKEIRKRSAFLVAIGNCACNGGIQAMELGREGWDRRFQSVYGENFLEVRTPIESKPIDAFVKVDFYLPGCPIDADQFFSVYASLIRKTAPAMPDYPVCAECRWKENECLLLKGVLCVGPLTAGGCGAVCPSHNLSCFGCFGPVQEANVSSEFKLLKEKGFTLDEIKRRLRMHSGSGILPYFKNIFGEV